MRHAQIVLAAAFLALLASCAPTTITPEELVVQRPFDETFSVVINTINPQPYPETSSGWVVTQSDQVGGFVTAELEGESCILFGLSCSPFTSQVSVALNARGPNLTAVNLSQTGDELARELSDRIADRLRAP